MFQFPFGPPERPDCDHPDCQQVDWDLMGMEPPRKRKRNLANENPSEFLDRLIALRDRERGEDDKPSEDTLSSWSVKPDAVKVKVGGVKCTHDNSVSEAGICKVCGKRVKYAS